MANIKWKCNDCEPNHYFEGDKFTSECPNCKSENIEQLKEDKFGFYLKFLQDNWKIVLPVIIGFIIFIWLLNRGTELDGGLTTKVYVASIEEQKLGTNYLEIKMEQWDSIDGHWKKSKSNLSENEQIDKISKYINYLSIIGESKQILPVGNKIFLCDKDNTDKIVGGQISVEYKGQATPIRFKKPIPFEFDLNGIQPDSKANCDEVCNIESQNIQLTANNCLLKVKIRNITPNRIVLVSVDGVNGEFKQKVEWDIKTIKKYDVWVKYDKSICGAVGSSDNGQTPPKNSCKDCNSNDQSIDFSKKLNAWGQDPNNRDLQIPCNEFYKSFIGGNNKFIVNGKVFNDWSDIYNIITNENTDDKKTFVLKNPVVISNKCTDITIEFIYD
jgi:hypothetical protein